MVTELNKLIKILVSHLIFVSLFVFIGSDQVAMGSKVRNYKEPKYDVIKFEDIRIFTTNLFINDLLKTLGKPIDKEVYVYEDGEGPDGFSETVYLKYRNIKITYSIVYGEKVLSSIDVFGKGGRLEFGNTHLSIGDSINKIEKSFPNSFEIFNNLKKDHAKNFYLYFIEEKNQQNYRRLINIIVENNKVTKVYIKLNDDT